MPTNYRKKKKRISFEQLAPAPKQALEMLKEQPPVRLMKESDASPPTEADKFRRVEYIIKKDAKRIRDYKKYLGQRAISGGKTEDMMDRVQFLEDKNAHDKLIYKNALRLRKERMKKKKKK